MHYLICMKNFIRRFDHPHSNKIQLKTWIQSRWSAWMWLNAMRNLSSFYISSEPFPFGGTWHNTLLVSCPCLLAVNPVTLLWSWSPSLVTQWEINSHGEVLVSSEHSLAPDADLLLRAQKSFLEFFLEIKHKFLCLLFLEYSLISLLNIWQHLLLLLSSLLTVLMIVFFF